MNVTPQPPVRLGGHRTPGLVEEALRPLMAELEEARRELPRLRALEAYLRGRAADAPGLRLTTALRAFDRQWRGRQGLPGGGT